jgi:hypothetical protein
MAGQAVVLPIVPTNTFPRATASRMTNANGLSSAMSRGVLSSTGPPWPPLPPRESRPAEVERLHDVPRNGPGKVVGRIPAVSAR